MRQLRTDDSVAAIVVFGSYARGDSGRKSDIDILILIRPTVDDSLHEVRGRVVELVSSVESDFRLPMQIAPLVADADDPEALGATLLHELWTDGIVLYGRAAALAMLRPGGLSPWSVVRFSLQGTAPKDRVRLARRLHGSPGKKGIIRLPGINLARGAALVPADQARAVRTALEEAGATYDDVSVWRDVGVPPG